jgi:SAM-dependent methyltransferase
MSTAAIDQRPAFNWDEDWYVRRYPDIAAALEQGLFANPLQHYLESGYREGRFSSAAAEESAQNSSEGPGGVGRSSVSLSIFSIPLDWPVQGEARKTFLLRLINGFFMKYMSGPTILDVGYKGGHGDAVPIFPHAIGIDLDYPGYDGIRLPFEDATVDTVFASHVLEHTREPRMILRDWFRVLKLGGFIVCIVPHQFLYERRLSLPSQWSGEHLRFYSPASLLCEIEDSLEPNSYRIKHLADNDFGYAYSLEPDHHPSGCYEIELVIEKIAPPQWSVS